MTEKETTEQVIIALRKIMRALDLNSKQLVKRVGLTGPQLAILIEVSKHSEISVGKLAEKVSLSQGTVTSILERLEKKGLVARIRNGIDKRKVMVSNTETGSLLLSKAPPLMQESFVIRLESLEEWERLMILSGLTRLVSLLNAHNIKVAPFLEEDHKI